MIERASSKKKIVTFLKNSLMGRNEQRIQNNLAQIVGAIVLLTTSL